MTAQQNPDEEARAAQARSRGTGQVVVIFAAAMLVMTLMMAVVIDVSWLWSSALRIQRAADAAALAGAVAIPNANPVLLARQEAAKNGYTNGSAGVVVNATSQVNPLRMDVSITAPVGTFFMRVVGLNSFNVTRSARAEFSLPLEVGSPENYYGVFGMTRGLTSTTTELQIDTSTETVGFVPPTSAPPTSPSTAAWAATSGNLVSAVTSNDNVYAQADATGDNQRWGNFNLLAGLAGNQTATDVQQILVELTDAHVTAACAGAFIQVALSYDGGGHWTNAIAANRAPRTGDLATDTTDDYVLPDPTSLSGWPFSSPAHTWTGDDLGNSNFRVRLTANKGCATPGTQIRVDRIRVQARFEVDTETLVPVLTQLPDRLLQGPGTACAGVVNCFHANDGTDLNPRGFWATINTDGAATSDGDAYQTFNEGGTTNPEFDPANHYNYAVEMPPGSSGGSVYIYDPVFCATQGDKGTGDQWFSGAGDPVSSFFELYDTRDTLYDPSDDGLPVASSAGLFRSIGASDTTMGGSGGGECLYSTDSTFGDARDYHNKWYLLTSGLSGGVNGRVYRLHTTSTDPASPGVRTGTSGQNSFAVYAGATVGTPRVYGIGAMQASVPLSADNDYYLALVPRENAGKWLDIDLWDPGDNDLVAGGAGGARVEILTPRPGSYAPVAFYYHYKDPPGTTIPPEFTCGPATSGLVSEIDVGSGTGNGRWLRLCVHILDTYTAPRPSGESGSIDGGWWKIRYDNDSGTNPSADLTTWAVRIRDNPVRLITR